MNFLSSFSSAIPFAFASLSTVSPSFVCFLLPFFKVQNTSEPCGLVCSMYLLEPDISISALSLNDSLAAFFISGSTCLNMPAFVLYISSAFLTLAIAFSNAPLFINAFSRPAPIVSDTALGIVNRALPTIFRI